MANMRQNTNLTDPKLLEKIDKLFELNIGEYVDLPQLLVVGDQSSGKSSVLEGLTGLPFPRNSGLCTRFATQITFRRAVETRTTISIIPSAKATADHAEKIRGFMAIEDGVDSLDQELFIRVLSRVHELMGLGDTAGQSERKTFSDDVLKIEICGPNQQHLSVVDVPGIFKRTTAGLTTRDDIDMVKNMVLEYMQNSRSIILPVIPANVDIATQEILELAEDCDREGRRTLGVLTKPDLVDKGTEGNIINIVEGAAHQLKLGWCIVKNPGQQQLEDPSNDRHVNERSFFDHNLPWSGLPKDKVGVEALRARLVEILGDMIHKEFGNVKIELAKRLKEAKRQLQSLGASRDTQQQQYRFLLDLATRFQGIVDLALKAQYAGDDIFESSPTLKLATNFVHRNTSFSEDVAMYGHAMHFKDDKSDSPRFGQSSLPGNGSTNQINARRMKRKFDELEDVLQQETTVSKPDGNSTIIAWLQREYNGSRGLELGTFDPSLLAIVWKKQSANWEKFALGYISDIIVTVHNFTIHVLEKICPDERARTGLLSVMMDMLTERYEWATKQTKFLLYTERCGTPMTMNHYFADNLEKSRQERVRTQLNKVAVYSNEHAAKVVRIDASIHVTAASNTEQAISDLHDILRSYYKVARKRFVDCVVKQAADHGLITGPDTPVKLLSPNFVSELSADQLESIAGEDMSTRRKRKQLRRDIDNLEKGKKVLM